MAGSLGHRSEVIQETLTLKTEDFSQKRVVYSQPKNQVIQVKKNLELISKNMSSQFQLKNPPGIDFYFNSEMSTGTGAPSG